MAVFIGRIACRDRALPIIIGRFFVSSLRHDWRRWIIDRGPAALRGPSHRRSGPIRCDAHKTTVETLVPEEQVDIPLSFSILDGYLMYARLYPRLSFQQRSDHIERNLRTLRCTYVSTYVGLMCPLMWNVIYVGYDVNASSIHSRQHFCTSWAAKSCFFFIYDAHVSYPITKD